MSEESIKKTRKSKATAHGSGEWFEERILAAFCIPLILWLISGLAKVYGCHCYSGFSDFVKVPHNAIALILFMGFFLKYTYLGMKVVFEDYVHCECVKLVLITGMKFIGFFAFTSGLLSVLKIFLS